VFGLDWCRVPFTVTVTLACGSDYSKLLTQCALVTSGGPTGFLHLIIPHREGKAQPNKASDVSSVTQEWD